MGLPLRIIIKPIKEARRVCSVGPAKKAIQKAPDDSTSLLPPSINSQIPKPRFIKKSSCNFVFCRNVLLLCGWVGAASGSGAEIERGALHPVRIGGGYGGDGEGAQALLRPRLAVARQKPRILLPRLLLSVPPFASDRRRRRRGPAVASPAADLSVVRSNRREGFPILPLLRRRAVRMSRVIMGL